LAAPPPSFGLSTWTLASSTGAPAPLFPAWSGYHPWPCTHPRGPRSRSGPRLGADGRSPTLHLGPPPV